jgi:hypothetical protein
MRKNTRTNRNSNQSTTGVFSDTILAKNIQERIVSLVERKGGHWDGSMTELDTALRSVSRRTTPQNWPSGPSVMRKVVNTVVNSLRRSGVKVQFSRTTDHMRKRVVTFEQR